MAASGGANNVPGTSGPATTPGSQRTWTALWPSLSVLPVMVVTVFRLRSRAPMVVCMRQF